MSSGLVQMLDLCRLCLVKDRVGVPIFEDEGDVRQVFLKIAACLPVKVSREDKLPKKICDDCMYKLELFYQFWNTTANAEKQLLQWLGEVEMEDKQGYVTGILNPDVMKQEQQQASENRLDGSVMQQVGTHQNMGMEMMDNMGLGMPIIISTSNQQMTSVPMDTSVSSVQTVQALPGPSTQSAHDQIAHDQIAQNQVTNVSGHHEEEEDSSEEEENETDDECDGDDGLPVKEEGEEDLSNRTVEPTTFVNVSLACDEAGPSGLQQQKITEMPEMTMPQVASADNKTGAYFNVGTPKKPKYVILKFLKVVPLKDQAEASKPEEKTILLSGVKKQQISMYDWKYDGDHNYTSMPYSLKETESNSLSNTEASVMSLSNDPVGIDDIKDEVVKEDATEDIIEEKKQDAENEKEDVKSIKLYNKKDSKQTIQKPTTEDDKLEMKKLLREIKKAALKTGDFSCPLCGMKYNRIEALNNHLIRKHTHHYEFPCRECGKQFKMRSDLTSHTRLHHRELPVNCNICGKQLRNSHSLYMHMKHNHYKSKFKCTKCNKRLACQENLDQHMLTQHIKKEKYVCEECGTTIPQLYDFQNHMRTHTGDKPYSCSVCRKSFARTSSLAQHLLLHTGAKLYQCEICQKSFTQRSGLICHRKCHKGPLPPLQPRPVTEFVKELIRPTSY